MKDDKSYLTELPKIRAGAEVGPVDCARVLLAEFDEADILEAVSGGPSRAAALGRRLVRVIDPVLGVIAAMDPLRHEIPLGFLREREGPTVLASVCPGSPYYWQLTALARPDGPEAKAASVLGSRAATGGESESLDASFPLWRRRCEEFDAKKAQDDALEAEAGRIGKPLAVGRIAH